MKLMNDFTEQNISMKGPFIYLNERSPYPFLVERPPSGAPYSYAKQKETQELIFSWFSWLAVLLVGAYARLQRRLYVGQRNERIQAKRCHAVEWGLLRRADSTQTWISKKISTKLPSI